MTNKQPLTPRDVREKIEKVDYSKTLQLDGVEISYKPVRNYFVVELNIFYTNTNTHEDNIRTSRIGTFDTVEEAFGKAVRLTKQIVCRKEITVGCE